MSDPQTFEPISYETWRERVQRELGDTPFDESLVSTTPEGFERQPLYNASDLIFPDPAGLPGEPPYLRGNDLVRRPWTVAVEHRVPDPEAIRADLELGAGWLWLAPAAGDPAPFLDGVDLERLGGVALGLDAGLSAPAAAARLVELAGERGASLDDLWGSWGADPLAVVARRPEAGDELDDAFARTADLAARSRDQTPGMRTVLVSSAPYHDAGGTAVDELAFGLASGVEALRRLTDHGLDLDAAAASMHFAYRVGRDLFVEIAKLRAARGLWARAIKACGGAAAVQATRIEVRGSTVTRTVRDPWVNYLRGTAEGFVAAVGGADSLVVAPFDSGLGRPAPSARRTAINTQHVLREEGHLGRVADPAGGSYYVETLTSFLARRAWLLFQYVERRGGMATALRSGWIAEHLAASADERRKAVAQGRETFVGVSVFPDLDERLPEREPVGRKASSDGLPRTGLAEPFERLRRASDGFRSRRGRRPRVLVVPHGRPSDYRGRSAFAVAFFAAGGIEAVDVDAIDGKTVDAGEIDFAVLCSSDELFGEAASELGPGLRHRGARRILVAGPPQEACREHVDDFVYKGCDAVAVLTDLLRDVGALEEGVP